MSSSASLQAPDKDKDDDEGDKGNFLFFKKESRPI
jgi:hypothetical protein